MELGVGRVKGEAAIADDQRRDALRRLLHALWLAQADQVVVAVRVDEARREISPVGIDEHCIICRKRRADCGDAAAADPHVAQEPRRACSVDDPRAAN